MDRNHFGVKISRDAFEAVRKENPDAFKIHEVKLEDSYVESVQMPGFGNHPSKIRIVNRVSFVVFGITRICMVAYECNKNDSVSDGYKELCDHFRNILNQWPMANLIGNPCAEIPLMGESKPCTLQLDIDDFEMELKYVQPDEVLLLL